MRRTGFGRWVALAILLSAAGIPGRADAGPRDHQSGFFLRLSAGPGGAGTEIEGVGGIVNHMRFSGVAGEGNLAVGAVVSPNLVLHGTLWGWSVTEPDVQVNHQDLFTLDNTTLTMSAVGLGVTYYLMPANVYLSGSIGLGFLSAEFASGGVTTTVDSDAGFAMDATLGKEWWVGSRWGLGTALGLSFHSIPDGDPSVAPNWQGLSLAIRFSATYN